MNDNEECYKNYLEQHWEEDLERIREFLRQPFKGLAVGTAEQLEIVS